MSSNKTPGPGSGIDIRHSVCTICDPQTQCGLDCYVRDSRIIKIEGTKQNPHSGGTLCSKGAAMRQYVYSEDRLSTPLRRIGPKGSDRFEPVGWDEALEEVAQRLNAVKRQAGPEAVVFFAGYAKWMRPFLQRLALQFGSPNYCSESSTCHQATAMAWRLVYGQAAGPDWRNSRCLLVWSQNPFHTNTSLARGLLDAREKGLKIIAVDPRLSPMASHADIHLRLRPGTDGALALGLANIIIQEELFDSEFVARHTSGFHEFREYASSFTPERTEELTGVPASLIVQAARMYALTKPASFMPSASPVVHHTNGVQNYRAAMMLIGLTGNYDVRGGNRVLPRGYLYISGAGFTTREAEYATPRRWAEMPPRLGVDSHPVWGELVNEAQAMALPAQIHSGKPYGIDAVFACGLNFRMWPNSGYMRESLEKLDFFCNIDLFMTDTCRYADIILPACSSVERSELRCYPEQYVILTHPAIQPVGESRPDVDIIFELARRLHLDDALLESSYEQVLDWILEPSGMSASQIASHPAGMFVPNPLEVAERKYEEKGFPTSTGKMEFVSSIMERHSHLPGHDALPVYHPPKHSHEATPELAAKYPFILNTGSRLPMFVHSRTFRLPWTRSLRPKPAADVNPADAEGLGIRQDDLIDVATPQGAIRVRANLTEVALPGVVHMYHAYPKADVNTLIPEDYLDPVSGFPGFKSLLCSVTKTDTAADHELLDLVGRKGV